MTNGRAGSRGRTIDDGGSGAVMMMSAEHDNSDEKLNRDIYIKYVCEQTRRGLYRGMYHSRHTLHSAILDETRILEKDHHPGWHTVEHDEVRRAYKWH